VEEARTEAADLMEAAKGQGLQLDDLDEDGDGQLSLAEVKATSELLGKDFGKIAQAFTEEDVDRSGALSASEIEAAGALLERRRAGGAAGSLDEVVSGKGALRTLRALRALFR